ncbi:MAG: PAS domain S-box protein [Rhodospirillaceae bacterium]|nr:PAS domain S-box protein [Rhodospirillaceae bacterium]MBT5562010.1 PAS domain S-box protein [Rhodospirillaceae bacterium]MBT6242183.1 PAS domain S-box protein [Rhodospirillaceae bacterium]MBT7136652.1 PAS domain S-box protein [Rhodospirillaceae bacterium]
MTSDTGRKSLGIRGRLATWFGLGAVGVLLISAAVVYVTGLVSIQGTLGQTYCQIASRVSDQFENHLTQKTSLIRNIAIDVLTAEAVMEGNHLYRNRSDDWIEVRLKRLDREWQNSANSKLRKEYFHPQLSQRLSILAGLEGALVKDFSVYDHRGVLIGSTVTTGDRVVRDHAWYLKVKSREEHFTYLDIDISSNLLKVVMPVWGGVNIAGFVYAELDFKIFTQDVMSLRFGQTGEAIAVDYAGVPLHGEARPFLIAALSKKKPSNAVPAKGLKPGSEPYWISLPTSDGGLWDRLVCVAPIASINALRDVFSLPGWSVVVTQSPDESYAGLKKSLGSFAVTGFFGVILVGFAGGLLAWTMTQPLHDLRKGVRQFARGDRDHPVKISSSDEIGELAEEFNRMARRVSQSENELAAFAQAVEGATDAIILTNPESIIYYANPSFERITGYSTNEAIGQRPAIVKSPRTRPETHRKMWKAISLGKPWRGEVWNKKKNGEIYPADLTISPILDESGHIVSFLGIQRDITLARAYQEQLEKEVEERSREITETRSLTVLGRMASMIAHDLRNALSTIKMNLQILNRKHSNPGDPEQEHTQIGLDQVRYMEQFLSDMLSYARPEKLQSDWHQLDTIIEDALTAVSHIVEKYAIEVVCNLDKGLPRIYCDRFKVIAALRNLIENAIHAMSDGGVMTISGQLQEQSANPWITIEVSDAGCGIEEDVIGDVMEPFFTTRTKGTGLGLAIVKGIIERHGGEISLVSRVGIGTQVSFTLPTAKRD